MSFFPITSNKVRFQLANDKHLKFSHEKLNVLKYISLLAVLLDMSIRYFTGLDT